MNQQLPPTTGTTGFALTGEVRPDVVHVPQMPGAAAAPPERTLLDILADTERHASELALVRGTLEKRAEPHWREFLRLWTA